MSRKKVLMDPGQKLVYDSKDNKVQLYSTSGESEIAWKEGVQRLYLKHSFGRRPANVEKRYNVEVHCLK